MTSFLDLCGMQCVSRWNSFIPLTYACIIERPDKSRSCLPRQPTRSMDDPSRVWTALVSAAKVPKMERVIPPSDRFCLSHSAAGFFLLLFFQNHFRGRFACWSVLRLCQRQAPTARAVHLWISVLRSTTDHHDRSVPALFAIFVCNKALFHRIDSNSINSINSMTTRSLYLDSSDVGKS